MEAYATAAMESIRLVHTAATTTTPPPSRLYAAALAELSRAVCPEQQEVHCGLLLDKSPSQEEFIRGTMGRAAHSSKDVGGPLMRHVKNFICVRLDMAGLVDDDFGMELLVGGKIVDLNLPVAQVYELVWKPHVAAGGGGRRAGPRARAAGTVSGDAGPMVVVYRLAGLDGEATEPVVKTLATDQQQKRDPEEEFRVARVLATGQCPGLAVLLELLLGRAVVAGGLLRLLHACAQVRACRRALLWRGAVAKMLHLTNQQMKDLLDPAAAGGSGGSSSSMTAEELLQLLTVLESLAKEANVQAQQEAEQQAAGPAGGSTAGSASLEVRQLASSITALEEKGMPACAAALARVMFSLAEGDAQAQAGLLDHFEHAFDMSALDGMPVPEAEAAQLQLQSFQRLVEALSAGGGSEAGTVARHWASETFHGLMLQRRLPQRLAEYLVQQFAIPWGEGAQQPAAALCERGSRHWTEAMGRRGVLTALQLLVAVADGSGGVAAALAALSQLLPLLHQMEGVAGGVAVGPLAEALLDGLAVAGSAAVSEAVSELRDATSREKKALALKKREAMLAKMGMMQVGWGGLAS